MKYNLDYDYRKPSLGKTFGMSVLVSLVIIIVIGVLSCTRREDKYVEKAEIIQYQPATAENPVNKGGPNANRFYAYAGIPKPTTFSDQITVLTNKAFLVGYSEKRRNPVWGCYRLFKVRDLEAPPRPKSFKTDARTLARVSSSDYTSSGYDRGHLGAPNFAIGVCYGAKAQEETFYMSNITPQKPHMNQDVFENMERMEIREYAQTLEEIWIIAGNIFDENIEKLKSGVEIPDACFHVIADEYQGQVRVLAFLIPQNVTGKEELNRFLTTVDAIEQKAGLDLLSDLPDDLENRIEAESAGMW